MGEQSQYWCPKCNDWRVFEREEFDWWLHGLLGLLTCGLWLVQWAIAERKHKRKP